VLPPPGVEDPISATFDLSDRVAQIAPTVRRMYRYTAGILLIWIVIMPILILVGLAGSLVLSILAVIGLAAGILALSLLRQTDRFFRQFVQRHRVIRLLREADPETRIPEGRTPVERLGRYLRLSNERIDEALKEDPGRLRFRVALPSVGRSAAFDLVLVAPGSALYAATGFGTPGFAILARVGPEAPTLGDLAQMAADAQSAQATLGAAVVRLLLLRTHSVPLPEDVYEYAVGHPVMIRHRWSESRVHVEIVTEGADGTYEFVPHVLGVP
jgi:hypothetical protein